jgi:hypothetical protein
MSGARDRKGGGPCPPGLEPSPDDCAVAPNGARVARPPAGAVPRPPGCRQGAAPGGAGAQGPARVQVRGAGGAPRGRQGGPVGRAAAWGAPTSATPAHWMPTPPHSHLASPSDLSVWISLGVGPRCTSPHMAPHSLPSSLLGRPPPARSEISLLARLSCHPNIITLHGFCFSPPDVALVTELMDFDLYDYIHRQHQVPTACWARGAWLHAWLRAGAHAGLGEGAALEHRGEGLGWAWVSP